MRVLLDTHTLLWSTLSPRTLSRPVAKIISDTSSDIFVSAASAWEIATKVRLNKLPEVVNLERQFLRKMNEAGYTLLSITAAHALRAGRLIGDHADPFDRMIAAQAIAEDLPVLSIDKNLDAFGIARIW